MMHMLGKAAEHLWIAVANHDAAQSDAKNEQGQGLKPIQKAQRRSPELIADYRKGDFQEKKSPSNLWFIEKFSLFEREKGVIRRFLSILWFIEGLARAVAAVLAADFLDSVVSCRPTTFVPFLVLWLRLVLRARTLCINTTI